MKTKLIYFLLLVVLLCSYTLKSQTITDFSTELPLVIISTNGETILDEPKIMATMKIISNANGINKFTDTANEYNGYIGIELRGSSSQLYPQKPYAIETRNADGSNNNVSILGMPEENDWALLSNYNDKSLMRNILGYKLFQTLGNYAPRAQLVDVIINGSYQGIYLLTEKIKRDKNRVDIAKLKEEDNSGEELTGGYIFKIDYWNSYDSWVSPYSPLNHPDYDVHFVFHDPKWDELTWQQKAYIENYVTEFESKLYSVGYDNPTTGYSKYIDVASFIDYFIVSEISRNNDGFKKSRYFYKDKNGKITAGPVWDFDWAWKNINECYIFKATDGSGWSYKINECNPWVKSPGWMVRLFYDTEFKDLTSCRYFDARENLLTDEYIFGIIDSVYNTVKNPQIKHFQKWDVLGRNVGAPEIDEQPQTYEGEVDKLKEWITTRLRWLDANMIGKCNYTNIASNTTAPEILLWPNPSTDVINLKSVINITELQVYNVSGLLMMNDIVDNDNCSLNIGKLKQGYYLVRIKLENGETIVKKFLKNR
ncbi:CotH kinase family protein [Prolixibacteraceae bacterium Z1-6]|uniref:CotH kinase family protein n=1 Tax=Draconibacterium aestuarii TaxID=2998507 RepID=A0A9X3FG02_9BACT|nr:CotH kinase family protein [Prolixibacteraceae bacterium Z1-6]